MMQNEIQEKLTAIWKDILHQQDINPEITFLEQGGNSLHFIKLATVVSKTFNLHIAPTDIFTTGTLSQLSMLVAERQKK